MFRGWPRRGWCDLTNNFAGIRQLQKYPNETDEYAALAPNHGPENSSRSFSMGQKKCWSLPPPRLESRKSFDCLRKKIMLDKIMSDVSLTKTWPELAIGLYDLLTERNAEIAYKFENLEVTVPGSTAANAERATWKLNGAVRITTRSGEEK